MVVVGVVLGRDAGGVRSGRAGWDAESRQWIVSRIPGLRSIYSVDPDAEQERLDDSYYWLSWGPVAVGGLILFFMAVRWALSSA
jgi:hypothetical protein